MTNEQALAILTAAAGHPTNGPVADILPILAEAIAGNNKHTQD